MLVSLDASWRVHLKSSFEVPADSCTTWKELRDIECFACQDWFHRSVHAGGISPTAGTPLRLKHRLLGIGFWRKGRILWWHNGQGYAFSDLSRRKAGTGFSHIYIFAVHPLSSDSSRVQIEVRGRWTACFLPRVPVRLWLGLMLLRIRVSSKSTLLRRLAAATG